MPALQAELPRGGRLSRRSMARETKLAGFAGLLDT
jgi:hypothetical protein